MLASSEQKLLLILFCLKTYPTFDVLGATFGLPRSKACEHAHRLAKALERCLRTLGVLPARAIDSLAPMQALFADVPVLLLDATERPYRRAHAAMDRPADYSGKKRPTRKNTLIADPARHIHYLGLTTCGATHDYQMLKNERDVNLGLLGLLDLFAWLVDLGYLGLVRDYDVAPQSLPHRKPRRSKKVPAMALTDTQRVENRTHARRRVKVEHAISGAKRLGCVTQVYRNKSVAFNNRVMASACGSWNWHLTKKKEII